MSWGLTSGHVEHPMSENGSSSLPNRNQHHKSQTQKTSRAKGFIPYPTFYPCQKRFSINKSKPILKESQAHATCLKRTGVNDVIPVISESKHMYYSDDKHDVGKWHTDSEHDELQSKKSGQPGDQLNCNRESQLLSWATTSNRTNPRTNTRRCLESKITSSDSIVKDSCSNYLNWTLLEDKGNHTNSNDIIIDDAFGCKLDDTPSDEESCSASINASDILETQHVLHFDPSATLSSLIKKEIQLKIQCRRVQHGLPEMPDMLDKMKGIVELSEEETKRQHQRLDRARQASTSYRRKFKNNETQLKEEFKTELQKRTQLQHEINLLKQTKDILGKSLQRHNCKQMSKPGVLDVCSITIS